MVGNDFLKKMQEEAVKELLESCRKEGGWRKCDTNTFVLACFGLLTNHLTSRLARPLWFFAASVCGGVIWFIVSSILGLK